MIAFETLRKFVSSPVLVEAPCELCSRELAPSHQHLLEPVTRTMLCSCDACAILFSNQGQTKYKRVPRRVQFLANFRMTDSQWDSLQVPIDIAFLFRSTPLGKVVALYPGPAGATESLLTLDTWAGIALDNPELQEIEADVEALLVNRMSEPEYFIVPIDYCFRLVGLIRRRWQGISGGMEVWGEIAQFFAGLKAPHS